jgi:hypothetical protein
MKSRDIIKAVLTDHSLCAEDFFGSSRQPYLVTARMDCARRMKDAGYEFAAIARYMKRNPTTVLYYLSPDMRGRKKDYYTARGALRYLPDHIQAIVSAYAKATDTSPRAVVSEVISSWAENEEKLRKVAA